MTHLKTLLFLAFFLSANAFSASIEIKKGNFGLRFENEVKSSQFVISEIAPFLECSTTFINHLSLDEIVTNTGSFKYTNYPESLKARFSESHYFQMVMTKQVLVEAPKKTFYQNKLCEFGVSLIVNQIDADNNVLKTGTIKAVLYKSDREIVDVIAELNALPPMRFNIKESWFGRIKFHFSEGGEYSL